MGGHFSRFLGRHLVCELHGISPGLLRDKELLRNVLLRAAEASGSTVVGDYFYKFEGDMGVTGVVVVAESHLSIHTWPEYGYAAVDVFTCGTHTDPWRALELLRDELKPERVEVTEMTRGILEQPQQLAERIGLLALGSQVDSRVAHPGVRHGLRGGAGAVLRED
jgi:S-adenosylmethionine decarboxylase